MNINLIAAVSKNGVIGKDNKLIWKLKDDMKLFKALTTGHFVIMGRKTFESMGSRLLPNRTNVIVTTQKEYLVKGALVVNSVEEAIELAKSNDDPDPFIIGGGEIYKLSIPLCDTLYITEVKTEIEGDTFFPEIDSNEWKLYKRVNYQKSKKNDFDFCTYLKIKS